MNRRGFLKSIAGVTAAGLVLPGEEVVRRFWRGWSPQAQAADWHATDVFLPETSVFPLHKGDRIGLNFVPTYNLVRIDDEVAFWTGDRLIRNVVPYPAGVPEDVRLRFWGPRVVVK